MAQKRSRVYIDKDKLRVCQNCVLLDRTEVRIREGIHKYYDCKYLHKYWGSPYFKHVLDWIDIKKMSIAPCPWFQKNDIKPNEAENIKKGE